MLKIHIKHLCEIHAHEVCEKFVNKHSEETIDYVKN